MKVTKLSNQVKNQGRVNVFVDGKYELSLTLDEILENKIKIGLELDKVQLKKLHKISSDGKIKARALEWLLSRPRSSKELYDYLHKKGLDKVQIESYCKYFAIRGYQNDEDFAKWWIDQRQRKNCSDLQIKSELRQKGIDPEIIVNNLQLGLDNQNRLKNLIQSKNLVQKYPERQKLISYLAGKGFGYSDIVDVLDGFNTDDDSF